MYLRADLSPAHRACSPLPRYIIVFLILRQIFEEKNCSAPSCLKNSRATPVISFLICWLINYNVFFIHGRESWFSVWLECYYEVTHCRLVYFLPGTVLVSVDYVVFLFLIRDFSISTFKFWHTVTNYTKLCNMTEPKVSVNGKWSGNDFN